MLREPFDKRNPGKSKGARVSVAMLGNSQRLRKQALREASFAGCLDAPPEKLKSPETRFL
jgi:hypothetical protein